MEQLPRGRHRIARADVVESQRRRLLAGVTRALVEEGFARLTVEDVVTHAGVSRKTFYEYFESREACLLAAYDAASEELWRTGEEAAGAAEGWAARVGAVLTAVASHLAADPERAHLFTREARVAGPEVAARQRADAERAAALLRAGRREHPAAKDLPAATELTLVENLAALVGANVLSGVAEMLPGLVPQLAEYLLEPYLGAEGAKAAAAAIAPPAQPGEIAAAPHRISPAA
ncbi:MAG TPA: helix-turn-helix domain-containing protein [Solirubrobacterales bacterium]|nr:helix-turn-helix domain-containing protein [Solirubrobacterales bacterium]